MSNASHSSVMSASAWEQPRFSCAHVKRFLEVWSADRWFRQQAAINPLVAAQAYNLEVDPEVIRELWDAAFARQQRSQQAPVHPVVERYNRSFQQKVIWRQHVLEECAPSLPHFNTWRQRQMARCLMQLGDHVSQQLIYTPLCFELSHGCSVGCSFCGLSAPPLSGIFPYTPEHARLWHEVLEVTHDFIGPAARWGSCYFATEPLDNPDYEKFCTDFFLHMDMFPQTTTALPLKNPERTKKLLKLARARGCKVDRFSILTLAMFKKVMSTFSPEELADVELILQNPESTSFQAATGRFSARLATEPDVKATQVQRFHENSGQANQELLLPGTISCLSGFLINMVNRTCKLVSPWHADSRWPLGYIVYNQGEFTDGESLHRLLQRMQEESMSDTVVALPRLRFRRGLQFIAQNDGFTLKDRYRHMELRHSARSDYYRELGNLLYQGEHNAHQMALLCLYKFGIPDASTLEVLASCFNNGILDEEPAEVTTNA